MTNLRMDNCGCAGRKCQWKESGVNKSNSADDARQGRWMCMLLGRRIGEEDGVTRHLSTQALRVAEKENGSIQPRFSALNFLILRSTFQPSTNTMKLLSVALASTLASNLAVDASYLRDSQGATDTTHGSYWWKFPASDCGYDDVSPQPACGPANKGNVTGLEECCTATEGCGGFNTNGIIKKTDCITRVTSDQPCDLYVLQDKPQPAVSDFPPIWPYPADFTNGTTTVTVSGATKFSLSSGTSPTLSQAFERYQEITFPHVTTASDAEQVLTNLFGEAGLGGPSPLAALTVTVDDLDESYPQLDTDETYNLTVPADGSAATLHAKTIYGALHGKHAFMASWCWCFCVCLLAACCSTSIISNVRTNHAFLMPGLETFSQLVQFDFETESYIVENAPWTITDAPRFPHRGLMIDTVRASIAGQL